MNKTVTIFKVRPRWKWFSSKWTKQRYWLHLTNTSICLWWLHNTWVCLWGSTFFDLQNLYCLFLLFSSWVINKHRRPGLYIYKKTTTTEAWVISYGFLNITLHLYLIYYTLTHELILTSIQLHKLGPAPLSPEAAITDAAILDKFSHKCIHWFWRRRGKVYYWKVMHQNEW